MTEAETPTETPVDVETPVKEEEATPETPTKEEATATPAEKKSLFDIFCGCMSTKNTAAVETKPEATSEAEPTKDETPAKADAGEAKE